MEKDQENSMEEGFKDILATYVDVLFLDEVHRIGAPSPYEVVHGFSLDLYVEKLG